MFTDMVGYSALTQQNEALALALLEEHRKIVRPIVDSHEGREIETAGDSFFIEFNSAVDAANCAIQIQSTFHERNKAEPQERHIRLRIGLHIGDVVYMDKHVHGDGVNIAARMEPLAMPGGICISEDVARQIRNKISFPVLKLGAERLKNISMPMDIYCIVLPWLKSDQRTKRTYVPKRVRMYSLALFLGILLIAAGWYFFMHKLTFQEADVSRFRLAVLPLSNISSDTQDEYFADGMTEELISNLSKIGGLNVIARTSIMKYKNMNKDIAEIGDELMVGSILEGSVRKFENKARITVQLIDVATQENLWSMDYDRELRDIFMIQSEIAQSVADELKVRLVSTEKEQLDKRYTQDMVAFQEYLVGKHYLNKKTSESIQNSIIHLEKSVQLDPAFALPYASLAYAYALTAAAGYGNIPRNVAESKAREAVMRSLELDNTLAEAHAALGYIRFRIDWNWKEAEKEFKQAIALKPGYATAHEWYALFLAIHSRLDESLQEIQKAYALDPLSPSVNNGLARIYHFRNEPDKAIAQSKRTFVIDPTFAEAYFTLGMTYLKKEEFENAERELQKAISLAGRRPVMLAILGATYVHTGKMAEAKALLAELQTPPMNNDKLYASSFILNKLGKVDESLSILEKLMDEKYGILVYMKVENRFINDDNNPRYQRMLQKMGLE
nr:adenylate/guanylate cyclase domain-containing protein [Rhodocytophaga rosea]